MDEPSLRTSRLLIAGGTLAAVAIGSAGFLIGRATTPKEPPTVVVATPSPVATVPAPERPRFLGRADIIAIANRAADATASRVALPQEMSDLAGRRFDLAIPFGCEGSSPQDSAAPLRWNYDTEKQTLRIHVSVMEWQGAEWGLAGPPVADYAGEGFWISRPWSSAESCPEHTGGPVPADVTPVTLPGQTLAVAQFKPAADDREPRRSFDTVQRVPSDQLDAAQGLRLRLTGRIDELPGGPPVRCTQPAGSEQRPICVVAVSFDELRIEGGKSGMVLATWALGELPQNN